MNEGREMEGTSDRELLCRYAGGADQDAFPQLVGRHGGWVYSAARRQLGDSHLAEDVTQAVFLLLARRAKGLRRHTYVSGWLFRAMGYCVRRAMRDRARLEKREREAATMRPETMESGANWDEIAPILEQAVASLPGRDRDAVLLRFYEQKPLAEVGRLLGVSEDAARMRVDRAVDKLRGLLEKHGVTGTSAGLSAALVGNVVQEVPARVLEGVMSAIRGGGGNAVAGGIAQGATRMMWFGKVRIASGLALAVIALVGVAVVAVMADAPTTKAGAQQAALASGVARGAADTGSQLSPDQLVQAVMAAKSKYKTVDVEFTISRYRLAKGERPTEPETITESIWRSANGSEYSKKTARAKQPDGSTRVTVDALAFAPAEYKQLREEPNGRREGLVTRDPILRGAINGVDPTRAMWEPYGDMWQQILNSNSEVVRDVGPGLLLLRYRANEVTSVEVTVDPGKGYLPAKTAILSGGKPTMWCKVTKWEQINGLWLPVAYTMRTFGDIECDYLVGKTTLNMPIPDDKVDIVFPSGTTVTDKIAGTVYKVTRVENGQTTSQVPKAQP